MTLPLYLAALLGGALAGQLAWLAAERLPSHVLRQWPQAEAAMTASAPAPRPALFIAAACALALACGARYGWTALSAWTLLLALGLLVLWDIDRRTTLLPDLLTLPLLWAGLIANLDAGLVPLHLAVLGAALGYLLPWLAVQGFRLLRGHDGMGGGDLKLMAALGGWFGALRLLDIVLAACGLAIAWMLARRRTGPMPFGPFLAAAGLAALFLPGLPG
ncbi:prepilin peptidase [Bordetella hinzii]|uniref:prepilin peptidase n=1 Tax=Bordetella hinzii TaxID=103855 RepID=UPI0013EFE1F0|nr:A24 family peptidase [Bordetella hinzii]QII83606.1 prepilin peptidase [Bordetella hinzii]